MTYPEEMPKKITVSFTLDEIDELRFAMERRSAKAKKTAKRMATEADRDFWIDRAKTYDLLANKFYDATPVARRVR